MKIFIILVGGGVFITLILVIYLVLEINSVKSDSVLRTEETAKVLKELEDIKNSPALKAARPQEGQDSSRRQPR